MAQLVRARIDLLKVIQLFNRRAQSGKGLRDSTAKVKKQSDQRHEDNRPDNKLAPGVIHPDLITANNWKNDSQTRPIRRHIIEAEAREQANVRRQALSGGF
jgi:hypothetical protein